MDFPHPFSVAVCQIVVDGNDMDPFPFQCIQVSREGRHQRFPFTGFHFRDTALMEDDAAN